MPTVCVDTQQAAPSQYVTVNCLLKGLKSENVGGTHFYLKYNSELLTPVGYSVDNQNLEGEFKVKNGSINCLVTEKTPTGINSDTVICSLIFKVNDNAKSGAYAKLKIYDYSICTSGGKNITRLFKSESGKIVIK